MKNVLYTWGANSYGQLGLGHAEDQRIPQCADFGNKASTLRVITGGGGHTAIVTESGELLVCGQNYKGQLGLGHVAEVMTFQLCHLPGKRGIQQVSCGWDFTIILTDNGQVFTCGSNSFGQLGISSVMNHTAEPLQIKSLNEPVINVAAGLRHALAVTGSGKVCQWGTGLCTQAKRALNPQPVPATFNAREPCFVTGLDQVSAWRVAAGSTHCACLTESGDVFLWGSNKHGQLCSTESFLPLPTVLDRSVLNGERVNTLHSGWTHLIAQTESGKVFTWGRADYRQLGRSEPTSTDPRSNASVMNPGSKISLPSEVKEINGATQIACGSEHNIAIVGNQVLSWGWNEHGMCGDGSLDNIYQPQVISTLQNVKALLIGCGAGHSIAFCCLKNSKVNEG